MTWQQIVMYLIGILLIYLAIKKKYEPALLLPMGFGAILVNLPNSGVINQTVAGVGTIPGAIEWLYDVGIGASEVMPLLLFIGIGAMIDFAPLLNNPLYVLFGFAGQCGVLVVLTICLMLGYGWNDAASIGIIGTADGPTAILVSQVLRSNYIGPIAVAAYSYMALIPIIQPITIKAITTKEERRIKMSYKANNVPKWLRIAFPIATTFIAGLNAPQSVGLVGFLMFGNLLRECGVLKVLSDTAQSTLVNLITLLLGLTISFTMVADKFVTWQTLVIMALGLVAFIFDTVGGVMMAKFLNLFTKNKINPMVGAAGISAFPMSARVIQKLGQEEDATNHLLMHAVGANVAGQIWSVMVGGMILSMMM